MMMAYASKNDSDQASCAGVAAVHEVLRQSLESLAAGQPFSANNKLRMSESYEGVVKHADDDQVVVVYEVEDELVEQTYVANQFIDGNLPKIGDRLAVFVHVTQLPKESAVSDGAQDSLDEDDSDDDVVPLPREF